MPASPQTLLAANLVALAYQTAADLTAPDVSALGCKLESIIDGVENSNPVVFGLVVTHPQFGRILAFRGTDDGLEALDDMDAALEPCPPLDSITGAQWHRGFGRVFTSLTMPAGPFDLIAGHSLGCPLAAYACLSHGGGALVLIASPKPGNSALASAVAACAGQIASFANVNDPVPRLPITVDWPWKFEDFQPIIHPTELVPGSVSPAVPSDWLSSHSLASYQRLLSALP